MVHEVLKYTGLKTINRKERKATTKNMIERYLNIEGAAFEIKDIILLFIGIVSL